MIRYKARFDELFLYYSWILDLRKKASPDQAYKNTYKGLTFLKDAGCLIDQVIDQVIDQAVDQAVDQDKDWKSET